MNIYQKDFFDIKTLLTKEYNNTEEAKKSIKPLLLKMNNPTFYKKHIYAQPSNAVDYGSEDYKNNPLVRFTSECIKILNESQELSDMLHKLQVEYSWTGHKSLSYWMKNA